MYPIGICTELLAHVVGRYSQSKQGVPEVLFAPITIYKNKILLNLSEFILSKEKCLADRGPM